MKIKELGIKLGEWERTRSIALATDICDELAKDMSEAAKHLYSEPTIYESEEANETAE